MTVFESLWDDGEWMADASTGRGRHLLDDVGSALPFGMAPDDVDPEDESRNVGVADRVHRRAHGRPSAAQP